MDLLMFPTYEAIFNGISLFFMFSGLVAIRKGARDLHRNLMLAAVAASAVFLGLYLVYHFNVPSKSYGGEWGEIYYPVLISHIVLAAVVPFLVGRVLWLAYRKDWSKHKFWARWTFPIWAYVSITGIAVYFFVHY